MRHLAGKLWERVNPLCSKNICSHFYHFNTNGPMGGLVSAPTEGPQRWLESTSHIHTEKNKTRATQPLSASSIRLQTGCGRIEGVP